MKPRYSLVVLVCAAVAVGQDIVTPTASVASPQIAQEGWSLIQSSGVMPADWINPKKFGVGENLSQMISRTCGSIKSLAERKGEDGAIIIASTPTYGSMWFSSRHTFVDGFTVVDEPLVVVETPLRTELWQRGCEYHMRKWYRVLRALRCGNEFRGVAVREVVLIVPAQCPTTEIIERCQTQEVYIDPLIYRQVEVPAVDITIVRPAELVVTVPNPVVEVKVEFYFPPAPLPIGFVPIQSGGQVNALPRRSGVERRLAGVSVGFVWTQPTRINNNVSATATGGAGGNATATQSQSQFQTQGQEQTCPPGTPPPPPPPATGESCPPLEDAGVPTQVDPVMGDLHPAAPTPQQAGG